MRLFRLVPFLLFIMVFLVSGCTPPDPNGGNGGQASDDDLRRLLPEREQYRWDYQGFAEYGHDMTLVSISNVDGAVIYAVRGQTDDMSGLQSESERSFTLEYIIRDGALYQQSQPNTIMDSDFREINKLIQSPLQVGTTWAQTVTDTSGNELTLNSTITGIEVEGGLKVYLVEYKDGSGGYTERRRIKEGVGVVSFEKTYEDSMIGYSLYYLQTGYLNKLALKSFLPEIGQPLHYYGFAEYAHSGALEPVSESINEGIYDFCGTFEDGSGIPGEFTVRYTLDYLEGTVTEMVLENSRSGNPEVNSKLHNPVILKLPIQIGTSWTQQVQIDGHEYFMTAQIIDISFKGETYYSPISGYDRYHPLVKVRYIVAGVPGYYNETYIEERVFQAGRGLVSFCRLLPGDIAGDKDLPIERAVANYMVGYGLYVPTE